jgi:hypothetical protein
VPAPAPDPVRAPFAYAIVRVVPRIERGEFVNAGIVLFCRPKRFLGTHTGLDEGRLRALDPGCDVDAVRAHLDLIDRIAAGDPTAGPIAALSAAERFHWLVSPASTIIQVSDTHTGITADPAATLDHLYKTLVEPPGGGA